MFLSGSSRRHLAYAVPATVLAMSSLSAYLYYSGRLRFSYKYPYISCSLRKCFLRDSRTDVPKLGASKGPLTIDANAYPWVQRDASIVEEKFGIEISDPYRWLEDPDSPQTAAFVESQNLLSMKIFEQCPSREKFRQLLTKLYDFPKYGCPHQEGTKIYLSYNSGLQNQSCIHVHDGDFTKSELFIDPNEWSEDGTVALTGTYFSKKAKYMGYTFSKGGSDWQKIKVIKIMESGGFMEMKDELDFVKFSGITWTDDELGFFYSRYPDPQISEKEKLGKDTQINRFHHICYHALGTDQSEDAVIFQPEGKEDWLFSGEISDDGNFLIIVLSHGCSPGNEIAYLDLRRLLKHANGQINFADASSKAVELVKGVEAYYTYLCNDGSVFTFHTNHQAPRYKIVQVDLNVPEKWNDIILERESEVLEWACAIKGDKMILCYMKDVANFLELWNYTSGVKKASIQIPSYGSIQSFSGKRHLSEVFFTFYSMTVPPTIYKYQAEDEKLEIVHRTEIRGLDSSHYVTEQVFVESYDSTAKIPMFITYKKGLQKNGRNPTLLTGYGGFNISILPKFSTSFMAFMMGYNGIVAVANLRGGGEYGQEWRDAGCLEKKQNVFDDFHACAEYLIQQDYCDSEHLAIEGGSNGGLLVAACANQRPDLYACVICCVGVLDMLRFHLFSIGGAWIPEFGDPDTISAFEYILKYSPLHNIRVPENGSRLYPSMLFTTADKDDRVSPLHTLKFLAELQHVFSHVSDLKETNPLIGRIDTDAGHGVGKPTSKVIREQTDIFSFVATTLRAPWNQEALMQTKE